MPISIDQPKSIRDSLAVNAMTYQHTQRSEDDHEELNDMLPEATLIAGISLAATFIAAGGDPSLLCIPGSMIAALVALLKSTQEKRDWTEKAANSIGISAVGSTLPSAILHYCWPDAALKMIWQGWVFLGMMAGFLGWPLAYAFVKVFGLRSERFANRTVKQFERRYLPEDQDSKDGRGGR